MRPNECGSAGQACRIDGEPAGTLAPVDIHAGVTTEFRVHSGDPASGSRRCSHWSRRFSPPLLVGVVSAYYLCPKIRQFARHMPQIPHRSNHSCRCSQAYPQKMGIDNSRAANVCRIIRIVTLVSEYGAWSEESGTLISRDSTGRRKRRIRWEEHAPTEER